MLSDSSGPAEEASSANSQKQSAGGDSSLSAMAASSNPQIPVEPASSNISGPPASTSAVDMAESSTPLVNINAARRPPPTLSNRSSGLNVTSDIQARMKAFHLGRQGTPRTSRTTSSPSDNANAGGNLTSPVSGPGSASPPRALGGGLLGPGGVPTNLRLPNGRQLANLHSAPAVPGLKTVGKTPSLAEKRGLAFSGTLPPARATGTPVGGKKKPNFKLSQITGEQPSGTAGSDAKPSGGTMMDKYSNFLDQKTGSLRFQGKATLNADGVEFAGGGTFSISLDEVDTLDELGKGNYGTVYKVRHSRPRIRKPGLGLAGNRSNLLSSSQTNLSRTSSDSLTDDKNTSPISKSGDGTTGAVMAMKEIRLELDDAKFAAIIMELDVLHRCTSPYIIDFYGAFFQEGAVYICMEFMDGGSIDKLYGDGVPENVLRKITLATTMGLKSLKEDHNIIHRDVKPTNILVNSRGQVKICDFGVSGNLVASIAKTNIGCQSYMAPERISSGAVGMAGANPGSGTYSVQSDIWSLGLTIIECALGRYPYPPETYNNIFSQLSAIVDGEPPDLPESGYSQAARNFVRGCLNKIPNLRPTYAMLLQHVWLSPMVKPDTIVEEDEEEEAASSTDVTSATDASPIDGYTRGKLPVVDQEVADWVSMSIQKRRAGKLGKSVKPALHAAPLDAVTTPRLEE